MSWTSEKKSRMINSSPQERDAKIGLGKKRFPFGITTAGARGSFAPRDLMLSVKLTKLVWKKKKVRLHLFIPFHFTAHLPSAYLDPSFLFLRIFFSLPPLPFLLFFFFLMLTGGTAWVPDASCVLTGSLPFSFALSHSAIREYTTKDPEGVRDRASSANSAWPSESHGGQVPSTAVGVGQPKCLLARPVTLRGSKTSEAGRCLVPQDNLERKHGNCLPKPVASCPVCHKGVMQNLAWLRKNPHGDFWRTCSRMPHHKTTTTWLEGCCQSTTVALCTKPQTKLTMRIQYVQHRHIILEVIHGKILMQCIIPLRFRPIFFFQLCYSRPALHNSDYNLNSNTT